jgi:outer membrane protein assembly factor BamE (lipoprotein component of BamABCDE complex)
VAAAMLFLLGACHPRVDTHGFMPNPELIEQVEPGLVSKFDVADILGSPSTTSTFDQDTWYYITQKTQNFAFFKPEIVDQQVLVVNFDDQDMVAGVHRYTIEDGLIVDPVSRRTPTVGKELTFLQQLFGNVGRFAK